jgi:hypothetical protein
MLFTVKFRNTAANRDLAVQPVQTEGSETYANSLVELKPGAAIVVKLSASAAGVADWPTTAGTLNVETRVGLTESQLEDSDYIYKAILGEVLSENAATLRIPRK